MDYLHCLFMQEDHLQFTTPVAVCNLYIGADNSISVIGNCFQPILRNACMQFLTIRKKKKHGIKLFDPPYPIEF